MYYRISKNEKILFFGKKIAQVWAVTLSQTNKCQKKNIDIQNKHIRECNLNNKNIFLQRYFHEESND